MEVILPRCFIIFPRAPCYNVSVGVYLFNHLKILAHLQNKMPNCLVAAVGHLCQTWAFSRYTSLDIHLLGMTVNFGTRGAVMVGHRI
jgi:hypothetical protein